LSSVGYNLGILYWFRL